MKKEVDLLLINPPFTESRPYISIPTLKSYLDSRGISTAVSDVNCEFYHRFFTRDRIRSGIGHVERRFDELNRMEELAFGEMLEYAVCLDLLRDIDVNLAKLTAALMPFSDFQSLKSLDMESLLCGLTTAPYFPEFLITKPYFTYTSPYFEFSIADIVESAGRESFYSATVREIVSEVLEEYEPKAAGLSIVLSEQVLPAFLTARLLKEMRPSMHVTAGGPFVSTYMRNLESAELFRYMDSLILDEGEIPLEQLVRELSSQESEPANVQSLVYVKDGKVLYNQPAETLPAGASPPPDYSSIDMDRYFFQKGKPEVLYRLSKGCSWHRCSFCRTGLQMCRDYSQAPHQLVYEGLLKVIRDTGRRRIHLTCEDADPELLEYISKRLLQDGISIEWRCHSRIDRRLTGERGELFRRAGCTSLYLGVESFSDRILRLMNKGITAKLIESVLNELHGAVPVRLYMMVGFPGETEQEALEGYGKVRDLMQQGLISDYSYSVFEVQAGSDVWEHPERFGISGLRRYDRSDLPSDILDFRCDGMSRCQAITLAASFEKNRREWDPVLHKAFERQEEPVREINVKGEKVEVRFDISEIIEKTSRSQGLLFIPRIGEWIRYGERHIEPVRALSRISPQQRAT